jgi:hypothetical protein
MSRHDSQATIEAIRSLAEEIARISPECADKAMQIRDLAKALEAKPDLAAIEDAIDVGTAGGLSETEVRSVTREVARTVRDEP